MAQPTTATRAPVVLQQRFALRARKTLLRTSATLIEPETSIAVIRPPLNQMWVRIAADAAADWETDNRVPVTFVDLMGVQAPQGLLGIHTNMPNVIPPAIDAAALAGAPVPAGLSADEKHAYEQLAAFYKDVYYALFMGTRPQTLTALADSPVGLATFMIDHDARSQRSTRRR